MAKTITAKQKLFADEYFICRDASKSAIKAGYSEKTAAQIGHKLVNKVLVKEYLAKKEARLQKKYEVSIENIIGHLARAAGADIRDFVTADEKGNIKMLPLEEIDGQLVTEIKQTKDGIQFKRFNPEKALELLGQYLNMFRQKVELSGPDGAPIPVETKILDATQRKARLNELLAKKQARDEKVGGTE